MTHRTHQLWSILRGDIHHLPRIVLQTVAGVAVFNIGWGFADPFFSLYLSNFADNYQLVGWFGSLSTLAAVLILLPLGVLLERVSMARLSRIARFGYIVVAGLYFLAGALHYTPLLLVALVCNGLLIPLFWTTSETILHQAATGHNASLAMGLYFTARQVAWVSGLALGLWLIDALPLQYMFVPVMVFSALSLFVTSWWSASPIQKKPSPMKRLTISRQIRDDIAQFPALLWAVYGLSWASFSIMVMANVFLPLLAVSWGWSLLQVGLLVLVINTPYLLSFIAAELADHTERFAVALCGILLSATACLALASWHTHNLWVLALGASLVLGYTMVAPALNSLVAVLAPPSVMGTASAMMDIMLFGSSMVFGPVIGWLIDRYGWQTTFFTQASWLGLILLAILWIMLYARRRHGIKVLNHPSTRHQPMVQ